MQAKQPVTIFFITLVKINIAKYQFSFFFALCINRLCLIKHESKKEGEGSKQCIKCDVAAHRPSARCFLAAHHCLASDFRHPLAFLFFFFLYVTLLSKGAKTLVALSHSKPLTKPASLFYIFFGNAYKILRKKMHLKGNKYTATEAQNTVCLACSRTRSY